MFDIIALLFRVNSGPEQEIKLKSEESVVDFFNRVIMASYHNNLEEIKNIYKRHGVSNADIIKGDEGKLYRSSLKSLLSSCISKNISSDIIDFLILQGADVDKVENNESPLEKAISSGNLPVVKLLIQKGARIDDPEHSALHVATIECSSNNDLNILKWLVEVAKIDINFIDALGNTALMRLLMNSCTNSQLYLNPISLNAIRYLLRSGSNIFQTRREKQTLYNRYDHDGFRCDMEDSCACVKIIEHTALSLCFERLKIYENRLANNADDVKKIQAAFDLLLENSKQAIINKILYIKREIVLEVEVETLIEILVGNFDYKIELKKVLMRNLYSEVIKEFKIKQKEALCMGFKERLGKESPLLTFSQDPLFDRRNLMPIIFEMAVGITNATVC